ncbi:MAG: aminodeoxychorismate/anthranilate synthase component II [Phycisphaerales bacterium]|nr:aminodeoxychorismate/anthranilate synthase component II [Phycisphaerales bacterium]
MLLLLDNYDSFTWNLVHLLGTVSPGLDIQVHRNDALSVSEIEELSPAQIVISPGPCTPSETGVCRDVIRRFGGEVPLLGVCLGHQSIADVRAVAVSRHDMPVHGRTSMVEHDGRGIFEGLDNPFPAARYHSLIVDRAGIEPPLEVSAWTSDGIVMALRDTSAAAPLVGLQFHPESFLTPAGPRLMANFLKASGEQVDEVAGRVSCAPAQA